MEMTLLEKQILSDMLEKQMEREAKIMSKNPLFKLLS